MRKKICRGLTLSYLLLLTCFPALSGERVTCVREGRRFSVFETPHWYVVECTSTTSAPSSRNKNLQDRRYRMEAVDMIGTYILFMQSAFRSDAELYQIFADAAQLHYQAYLNELEMNEQVREGKTVTVYRCRKENYDISEATFRKGLDLKALLKENYNRRKDAASVEMMARYGVLGFSEWLSVERDFLTGSCQLPGLVRRLQSVPDRLERSMVLDEGPVGKYAGEGPRESIHRVFFLEEMVTALPLARKRDAYKEWFRSLAGAAGPIPDVLRFCAQAGTPGKLPSDPVFTELIEAFPGALSPFGVRCPLDSRLYDEAVEAYSDSDFARASELLAAHINEGGLSPAALNLLGASLRFQGKTAQGLSCFLLCLKMDPSTQYLIGNFMLALQDLGYPGLSSLAAEVLPLAADEWSRKEVSRMIRN